MAADWRLSKEHVRELEASLQKERRERRQLESDLEVARHEISFLKSQLASSRTYEAPAWWPNAASLINELRARTIDETHLRTALRITHEERSMFTRLLTVLENHIFAHQDADGPGVLGWRTFRRAHGFGAKAEELLARAGTK